MRRSAALTLALVLSLGGLGALWLLVRSGADPERPELRPRTEAPGAPDLGGGTGTGLAPGERAAAAPSPLGGEPAAQAAPAEAEEGRGPIRVRCVDELGRGLAGVQVAGWRKGQDRLQRIAVGPGETDVQGRVRFPALVRPTTWPTTWPIERLELDLQSADRTQVRWRGEVPEEELVLQLPRGGVLHGTVARTGGQPLPRRASVLFAWSAGPGLEGEREFPIVGGEYATEPVIAGEVLRATFVPLEGRPVVLGLDGVSVAGGEERRLDLVFPQGCDCRASFVDEDGAPIVRGQVVVPSARSGAVTDEAGTARLADVLGPGQSGTLRFHHEDHAPLGVTLDCPDPPLELEVRVVVPRGHELAGIVQDTAGLPLPDVEVRCLRAPDPGMGALRAVEIERRTTSDAAGAFRLRGFPAGNGYSVIFSRGERVLLAERIAFPPAEERLVWTMPDPVALDGRLLDHAGVPVPGAEVFAKSRSTDMGRMRTSTGEDGGFRFEGMFPGRWVVAAPYGETIVSEALTDWFPEMRPLVTQPVEVAPRGSATLELRLPPPRSGPWPFATFRLRVLDERSGAPLVGLSRLTITGRDNTLTWSLAEVELGEDGYRRGLPAGAYELHLDAEGYVPATVPIDLPASTGAGPLDVEVRLRPAE